MPIEHENLIWPQIPHKTWLNLQNGILSSNMKNAALRHTPALQLWDETSRERLIAETTKVVGRDNSLLFSKLIDATAQNEKLLEDMNLTRRWERYWADKSAVREVPDFETLGHTIIVVEIGNKILSEAVRLKELSQQEASQILVAMLEHDIPEIHTKDHLYMLQTAAVDEDEIRTFRDCKKEWWGKALSTTELNEAEDIFVSVFHGDQETNRLTRIARGIDRVSYVLTAIDLFNRPRLHCEVEFLASSVLYNHGTKLLNLLKEFSFFSIALTPRKRALEQLVQWAHANESKVKSYIVRDLLMDSAEVALESMLKSEDYYCAIDLREKLKTNPIDLAPWFSVIELLPSC